MEKCDYDLDIYLTSTHRDIFLGYGISDSLDASKLIFKGIVRKSLRMPFDLS
jgi:hypothetical protein